MIPHWSEITAVFGGTFDPPHLGHREAVQGLFHHLGVQRVVILPTASPPHKPCQAAAVHRAEMTKLTFADQPGDKIAGPCSIELLELERAERLPGRPSYSYDTLQELKATYPALAFVIGADQLAQLHTWHRFPELLGLCHWIVLARRPDGLAIALQTLQKWEGSGLAKRIQGDGIESTWALSRNGRALRLSATEAREMSSTQIRHEIAKTGTPPETSLIPAVIRYLNENRLYGSRMLEADRSTS